MRSASFALARNARILQTLRFEPRRIRVFATMSGSGGANGEIGRFNLSPSTVLKLQKGDITAWSVDGSTDAIVNAANERMLGGGGVDGAIHRAAGPELRAACAKSPEVRPGVRCPTGEARITPAFQLPVSCVIHTVGPIYYVDPQPEASLRNAYRNSLRLAKQNNIQYITFPAISCGVYGYPYTEASRVAISTIKQFSNDFKEMTSTRLGWRLPMSCCSGGNLAMLLNYLSLSTCIQL